MTNEQALKILTEHTRNYIPLYDSEALEVAIEAVRKQMTGEVANIVRCEDCLYNENGNCMKSEYYTFDYRPDFYCADGERMDGAKQ